MAEGLLRALDLTQPSDLKQLVPCSPLITSEAVDWKNIRVQHHQQAPWEMPENTTTQHVIAIHWAEAAMKVDRVMDGQKQQDTVHYGSCVIVPAHIPHQSVWNQEIEFTLLLLEPSLLARTAYETVDGDRVELIPQFSRPDPILSGIGSSLKSELETNGSEAKLYVESATTFLAAHLLRHHCTRNQSLPDGAGGLPKYKLRMAIAYIQEHLGEEITLEAIATQLNMSQYYFCHLFKQSMGVSPYQYVLQQRINKAKQLLKQRQLTITDVALECGFANQTHFTKYFRKLAGTTPKNYREQ